MERNTLDPLGKIAWATADAYELRPVSARFFVRGFVDAAKGNAKFPTCSAAYNDGFSEGARWASLERAFLA